MLAPACGCCSVTTPSWLWFVVGWLSTSTRKPREASWQAVLNMKFAPAAARLPARVGVERRDVAARHALLCRIHGEFEEMPGLLLTLEQAAKLFGVHRDIASRIFERLIDARVLCRKGDAQFALRVED